MAYELKDGSGNLFRNDKGDNEKRPDYRGELKLCGDTYTIAGWVRKGKDGKKDWLSLAVRAKDESRSAPRAEAQSESTQERPKRDEPAATNEPGLPF